MSNISNVRLNILSNCIFRTMTDPELEWDHAERIIWCKNFIRDCYVHTDITVDEYLDLQALLGVSDDAFYFDPKYMR